MSILSDSNPPRQGQLTNPTTPPMTSKYGNDVSIRCECCYGEMINPIQEGAITFRAHRDIITMTTYTGFHITHRSSHCIDNLFKGAARSLWMPLDEFFKTGDLSFDWFTRPRYDDNGNAVDYDLNIDRESLERIAIALRQIVPPKVQKPAKKQPSRTNARDGFVYLIQSPTGTYKIGRTVNPADRMKTFTVKLPFEVEYTCVIPADDMYYLERTLHAQFADKRVNGEWFKLSPEDVEYIKGLAT